MTGAAAPRRLLAAVLALAGCALANTPQQDLAYERWAKCARPYASLERVDPDGRITFQYSDSAAGLDIVGCLAAAGRGGPPLPPPLGVRPRGGP